MVKKDRQKISRVTDPAAVLAAIDFSGVSEDVLAQAMAMSGANVHIILLHVLSPGGEATAQGRQTMDEAHAKLSEFGRRHGQTAKQPFEYEVRAGAAFQEIVALAKERKVELIVIGADASSSLGGVALGHTADRVSRYAPCPVLLVREDEAAKSSPTLHRAAYRKSEQVR